MKRKKDFYKYNLILGTVLFVSILTVADLNSKPQNGTPDFTPNRYTASIQKARQTLAINLYAISHGPKNEYQIQAEIQTLQSDLTLLNYKWTVEGEGITSQGDLTGVLDLTKTQELQITVQAPIDGKIKLELIGESNGIRIGGSKIIRLNTETQNEFSAGEKISSEKKTKTEILKEIFRNKQKLQIQQ